MQGGLRNELDCIKAFSETDFTEDLKRIDIPTLIIHGDDDQIVPIANTAMLASKLIKKSKLKIYKGGPHGLADTFQRSATKIYWTSSTLKPIKKIDIN